MRPHKIQFYGAENLEDTTIPDILFRAWLSHMDGTNHLLVLMERVDLRSQETRKYWVSVNNRSWHPGTAEWNWKNSVPTLSQSVEGQTVYMR